ncbi:MAG: hypothetical protein ABIG68_09765 [Acidobacteriota bacterium]
MNIRKETQKWQHEDIQDVDPEGPAAARAGETGPGAAKAIAERNVSRGADMAKEPGFYLYTGDWKKDPQLSMCSPAARGIWIDLLCAMHDSGRVGKLTGSIDQLSVLGRCSPSVLVLALTELATSGAADVAQHYNLVTITSRRMSREAKVRESARKRMKKHRAKKEMPPLTGAVAPPFMPSSLSLSSSDKKKTTTTARAKGVTSASRKIVAAWNSSVPQGQRAPSDGTPAIDRACSALLMAAPPVEEWEILAAIENYRQALKVPNSQAYAHSLGQFLRRANIDNYLPGNFNPANYDRKKFARGEQTDGTPEELVERLKGKGLI